MMLARIIQFLIGVAFGAGGGYLVWTHRAELDQLFPPGPAGLPLVLVAGIGAASLGLVFLVSSVAPRPKRTARLQAAAARRAETLRAADAYYSERSRAADRDWRSGKLPPHTPGAGPVIDPLLDREPVRAAEPEAAHDPLFDPAAVRPSDRATEWKTRTEPLFEIAPARPVEADAKLDPLFDPEPRAEELSPRPVATEPAARSAAAKPVATSMPPMAMAFPSTATLSPIPRSSDPPPHLVAPPSSASIESSAAMHLSTVAPSPAPAVEQFSDPAFADIRAAIKDGRLEDADRLLNASRETATGLALAELTGLAGDHAAAAGRQSNAKWLWRLALKRFGEAGAIDSPAARQVSERLRLAGQ